MPMDWTPPQGGGKQPDLGKIIEKIKKKVPLFKTSKKIWLILLLILTLMVGSSCYYTIDPEETGVVLRFGKCLRESNPGLHFKLPFDIETVEKVKTGRVFKQEFGFRENANSRSKSFNEESLMLTGDLSVIDVKWIVQFKIQKPRKWLFAVRDGISVVRDLSEAVMRSIVGNRYGDKVLTLARVEIAKKAHTELQKLLNTYDIGVQVITVKLQDVNPPVPVQPAFNEVNEARQQKERMINEAQESYNREIPRALGKAKRIETEAEGYATERLNRAEGEVHRFNQVLLAYRHAKNVTKRRFYLETMQKVLKNVNKIYLIDEEIKALLPLLNIGEKTGYLTPNIGKK